MTCAFSVSSETHRHLRVFCSQVEALLHLLGVCSTCRQKPCSIYLVFVLLAD